MKAVVCTGTGGTEVLQLADVPEPTLSEREVLLEVRATALNRADLLQRRGLYPPPPGTTDILGLECSGVVLQNGPGAGRFAIGTRVMALLPGGGYAERVAVHEDILLPVPERLSFEQAAAVPEAFLTASEALLVEAWDGWCNYGIAENDKIKYVIPKEGSDLWVDTMVITAASENKDAAHKFIDYVLGADNGKWVVENIMYKTPNKAGMEAIDKSMLDKYPNMAITPAELLKYEQLRDLGDGQKAFSKTVTEILAAK